MDNTDKTTKYKIVIMILIGVILILGIACWLFVDRNKSQNIQADTTISSIESNKKPEENLLTEGKTDAANEKITDTPVVVNKATTIQQESTPAQNTSDTEIVLGPVPGECGSGKSRTFGFKVLGESWLDARVTTTKDDTLVDTDYLFSRIALQQGLAHPPNPNPRSYGFESRNFLIYGPGGNSKMSFNAPGNYHINVLVTNLPGIIPKTVTGDFDVKLLECSEL